jgi:hypothetical protein
MQRWNHVNVAVPPERMPLVEACIDAAFGWTKFVSRSSILGYRFSDDLQRLRVHDATLDTALARLDTIDADWADHTGFMVGSVEEWEERLAAIERLARERPEFDLRVVDVLRPGDDRAPTDYLYQAFIRVGLLGPLRNTFEMQARTR